MNDVKLLPKGQSRIDKNDIVGKVFGRLTVLSYDHFEINRRENHDDIINHYYKCQCSCEDKTIRIVRRSCLLSGMTRSCGCIGRESASERQKTILTPANTKHNMCYTRLYSIWSCMKGRCSNPNNKRYQDYGGRGITYDPKWETFEGFYEDMYEPYCDAVIKKGHGDESLITIDRIDVNGNYCKENCQWATLQEQNWNTTRNKIVEYNSNSYNLLELHNNFCTDPSISVDLLRHRIFEYGWDVEKALTTPHKEIPRYLYNNKLYTTRELVDLFCDRDIHRITLYNRLTSNYKNCMNGNVIEDSRIFRDEKTRTKLRTVIRFIDPNKEGNNHE